MQTSAPSAGRATNRFINPSPPTASCRLSRFHTIGDVRSHCDAPLALPPAGRRFLDHPCANSKEHQRRSAAPRGRLRRTAGRTRAAPRACVNLTQQPCMRKQLTLRPRDIPEHAARLPRAHPHNPRPHSGLLSCTCMQSMHVGWHMATIRTLAAQRRMGAPSQHMRVSDSAAAR